MKLIYLLVRSSKRSFFWAMLSGTISGASLPLIIKLIGDAIENQMPDQTTFILQFVGLWLCFGIFNQISVYTSIQLTNNAMFEMRMRLVDRVLKSSFQKIEHDILKVISVFTHDIVTITLTINRMPALLTALATVLGCFVYLIILSWKLSVLIGILIFSIYLTMKLILPRAKFYADKTRGIWDQLFHYFEGLLYGLKELMLNRELRQSYSGDFLPNLFTKQNKYSLKQSMLFALSTRSVELILFLGIAAILVAINQTGFVEFSFFGKFLMVILFILSPLATLSNFINDFKKTEVAINKIENIEETLASSIFVDGQTKELEPSKNELPLIELVDIKHKYFNIEEDESFELGPINMTIQKNEVIFLVGGNGSGKTTLAKILVGLYLPESGTVRYNGQTLTPEFYDSYRNKISANFTDQYLFQTLSHISDEVLEEHGHKYLEKLELTKKLKITDKKFSTTSLSQGQKKRLSLITSLLEDKEIYLFDEWAANQDPHFKNIFYHYLLPDLKLRGKTVLVISHDESYFGHGDRIVVLEDGHIKEKMPVKNKVES